MIFLSKITNIQDILFNNTLKLLNTEVFLNISSLLHDVLITDRLLDTNILSFQDFKCERSLLTFEKYY